MTKGDRSVPEGKPIVWMGQSLRNVRAFPLEVRQEFGFALYQTQRGFTHEAVKPLKGFGEASVLEVVEAHVIARQMQKRI